MFVTFGGGFRGLVNFLSVASWTFYLLTVSLEEIGAEALLIASRWLHYSSCGIPNPL